MQVLQTIPILRIFAVAKAREFYEDFLGFHVDSEHRFEATAPVYLQVSRDGCVLHLLGQPYQVRLVSFRAMKERVQRRRRFDGVGAAQG
jgi:catechol 2,3-dioxygenase-like lactoylglutathione lyase family enzyme